MKNRPPSLARKLLLFFLRDELAEEVIGDLDEKYYSLQNASPHKANRNYWKQVFSYLRPFAIKKTRFTFSNPGNMFRHNVLISYRNFIRHKNSFLINLIGLSTGIACALFIYLWVNDELQVDKFNENDGRLYRVMENQPNDGAIVTTNGTPGLLAESLASEYPEIEYASVSTDPAWYGKFTLSSEDIHQKGDGIFVGKDFFKMFTYKILEGSEGTILKDRNSIVISDDLARAMFHTTDNLIGKPLHWQLQQFSGESVISGVFKKMPSNSSDQFDFILSFEVLRGILGENLHWGNNNAITYVLLKKGADPNAVNQKIESYVRDKKLQNVGIFLQKYSDKYLYGHFENGQVDGGRIEYVRLFSIIAVFILLIACINFMNLSTAKATRRIKEVGIKKAIGAGRRTLIYQHLGESILLVFISMMVALALVYLFMPQFNLITGKYLLLNYDTKLIITLIALTFITGIISGSYPALYLSGFKPASVLKGELPKSIGEVLVRKGLVVFQFCISIILIVSVIIVYKQIEYVQTKNLGYNKENIITFSNEGGIVKKLETFLNEVRAIPGVVNGSSISHPLIHSASYTYGKFTWEGRDPNESIRFENVRVGYDMLETLGIQMAEGRAFSRDFPSDTSAIIINEAGISVMRLKDPIGKTFGLWGKEYKIIGIARDFNFESLHQAVRPLFVLLDPKETDRIMVKISTGREKEAISGIEELYKKFNPGYSFDYTFLDKDYQSLYQSEMRVASLSKYFASLAILISCLGLFGLAAFTTERRTKEISIRKVLGSGNFAIIRLLSTDFTKMVIFAIVISLPVSYLLATRWLQSFAYRIDLKLWYFLIAGAAALFIAWFTVGLQTIKAARINPAERLKNE